MRSTENSARKRLMETAMAIAEGLWNGIVVSGVLAVTAFLFDRFIIL